jgi:hypothetical protein
MRTTVDQRLEEGLGLRQPDIALLGRVEVLLQTVHDPLQKTFDDIGPHAVGVRLAVELADHDCERAIISHWQPV